ncbi:PorV/PorQ family protein, partial [bacterium]|nr:PorV/PorQ family protein [bacterium]
MKRVFVILLAGFVLVVFATADSVAQGISGAYSLKIPPGARANGMGQSNVALVNDGTSLWWNPAGMSFVQGSAVDLMHSQLVPGLASDVFFEYIGGVRNIGGGVSIGAAIQYLTYGEWEATMEGGQSLGIASSFEVSPVIGGSIKIMDNLSIGMNFKFVYISLAPKWATVEGKEGKGSSVAVDMGAIWRVPELDLFGYRISRLNLGMCLSNFGPSISYIDSDQAAPLPRTVRGGFAYTPYFDEVAELRFVGEIERELIIVDVSSIYHGGAEFIYANLFAIRAGYVYDDDGDIKAPTYGLG